MTHWSQILDRASMPPLLAGLALPLVAGAGVACWDLGLPVQRLAESRAMVAFWLVLLILLAVRVLHSFFARSLPGILLAAGLLLATLLAGMETSRWFRESVSLGEGETGVVSGKAGLVPGTGRSMEITYLESIDTTLRVRAGEQEIEAERGAWIRLGDGLALRVTKVAPAPSFAIQDGEGRELEGYLKLADEPAPGEYIRVGLLPHRLYLSRTVVGEGSDGAVALSGAAARGGVGGLPQAPDELHLRVLRGKLTVADSLVKKGEAVPLEGFTFRYDSGATWAEIDLKSRIRWMPLALAMLLMAVGLALGARGRSLA